MLDEQARFVQVMKYQGQQGKRQFPAFVQIDQIGERPAHDNRSALECEPVDAVIGDDVTAEAMVKHIVFIVGLLCVYMDGIDAVLIGQGVSVPTLLIDSVDGFFLVGQKLFGLFVCEDDVQAGFSVGRRIGDIPVAVHESHLLVRRRGHEEVQSLFLIVGIHDIIVRDMNGLWEALLELFQHINMPVQSRVQVNLYDIVEIPVIFEGICHVIFGQAVQGWS